VYLSRKQLPRFIRIRYRKTLPYGIELAAKVKRSQGRRRIARRHQEHPFTAISPKPEVHANHVEANNSSIRRRCSAMRRRQNHYAKKTDALQRAITVLRLIHNWHRPHPSLPKGTTPAMAMGYVDRPLTVREMLLSRGFSAPIR
jgi:hypothetical protein